MQCSGKGKAKRTSLNTQSGIKKQWGTRAAIAGDYTTYLYNLIKLQILESETDCILLTTIKGKPSLTQAIWPEMLMSIVLVKILMYS